MPAFARLPVLAFAGAVGVILLIASRNYGYFFDEAYFVVAGRDHLAWGYFDQPPLVPALAATMNWIAPGSLVVLRIPAVLAAVGGIVVAALLARELGGGRAAQLIAAVGYAFSASVVVSHWLATYSLDPFFWTTIVWLVVRWTRVRDDRLLLVAGAVTALSLQTKFLVPALWVALMVCALVFGPRAFVTRPKLWAGGAVAVVATVPALVWQWRNDWPYAQMSSVVADEFPGYGRFLWDSASGAGLLVGLPLVVVGIVAMCTRERFRPYRFVMVALLGVFFAFLMTHGRSYYVCGLYALPIAAGAVVVASLRFRVLVAPLVAAAAVVWLAAVPVYPRSWAERIPDTRLTLTAEAFVGADTMIGSLSDVVTDAYRSLPQDVREHTAIVAESYPFAAAVDLTRERTGLPRAYSGHRGYWYFGTPPDSDTNVLYLGSANNELEQSFSTSQVIVPDLAVLYVGRTVDWGEVWPSLRAR